jgi:transcriptional antiterminator RfaH
MSLCAWYTMFSKPRKEIQVEDYLRNRGFEVFHPMVNVKPANPRALKTRSYFPRYLFVRADMEAIGPSALEHVPGSVGLVQFDGYAPPIADTIIYELRRRMAALEHEESLPLGGLRHGDPVFIVRGPFAGYDAIFDTRLNGQERVQVLLHWLGREVHVEVHAQALEQRRRARAG